MTASGPKGQLGPVDHGHLLALAEDHRGDMTAVDGEE
jgi:hypothetical protein